MNIAAHTAVVIAMMMLGRLSERSSAAVRVCPVGSGGFAQRGTDDSAPAR